MSLKRIYLDHNATSPLRDEAREAMLAAFALVGNASSPHQEGRQARGMIDQARDSIAALCGANARDVIFTSGATEANGLALSPLLTSQTLGGSKAQGCDTLLVLDELAQVENKDAGGIAYSLSNGQGKARAHRTGTAKPVMNWRILFLSAGEIGLAVHMAEGGKKTRAGQETRLAEVPADAGAGLGLFETLHDAPNAAAFAIRLKDATSRQFGHVGPAFVERLLAMRESWSELAAAVKGFGVQFAGDGADGQVQRVARRFALVAVAGELATRWGLTGWSPGTASKAAQDCFNAWVATRGGKGNLEPRQVLAQLRAFLELHGEARFTQWGGDPDRATTHRRAGFWRERDGGRWFYVLPEVMRQEVLGGLNTRDAQRALLDAGVLEPDSDGKATRSERLPGFGNSTRCYVVNPNLWGAANG